VPDPPNVAGYVNAPSIGGYTEYTLQGKQLMTLLSLLRKLFIIAAFPGCRQVKESPF